MNQISWFAWGSNAAPAHCSYDGGMHWLGIMQYQKTERGPITRTARLKQPLLVFLDEAISALRGSVRRISLT